MTGGDHLSDQLHIPAPDILVHLAPNILVRPKVDLNGYHLSLEESGKSHRQVRRSTGGESQFWIRQK